MVNCVRCKKDFRNQYDLTRHQSRKFPCKEIVNDTAEPKDTLRYPSDILLDFKNNETVAKKHKIDLKNTTCEFCLKTFATKKTLTKHYNCCKAQDDPIRHLEIEAGITPVLSSTECRFCLKQFSRPTLLNQHRCTAREKYHNDLKRGPSIVNNNNTTNNTVNNTVNNFIFNQETYNLQAPDVLNEMKKINKMIGKAYNYLKAGTLITAVDTMIRSHPENQNVLITTKAMTGQILTAAGWITDTTDNILERCFQQSAIRLKKIEQQLKEYNSIAMEANKDTWGEVGHFANNGLQWHGLGGGGANGDQIRRVRTGFKVALSKLKLKKII